MSSEYPLDELLKKIGDVFNPGTLAAKGGKAAVRGAYKLGTTVGKASGNALFRGLRDTYDRIRQQAGTSQEFVKENPLGATVGGIAYRGYEAFGNVVESAVDYFDPEFPLLHERLPEFSDALDLFLENFSTETARVSQDLDTQGRRYAIEKAPGKYVRVEVSHGGQTLSFESSHARPWSKEKALCEALEDLQIILHDFLSQLPPREAMAGKTAKESREIPVTAGGRFIAPLAYTCNFTLTGDLFTLEYLPPTGRGLTFRLTEHLEAEPWPKNPERP